MSGQLLVAITENPAKLEPEQNLRPKDQHAGLVESCFDFFRKLYAGSLEERK